MHILAAPDSFKGSLSATDAAQAMEAGIKQIFPDAQVTCLPLADGGEGTVEAMLSSGGERRKSRVTGPLEDMRVEAEWALMPDGTAVIESAAASGMTLLKTHELDAGRASSYGTGELIVAALEAGAKRIIVGLGGSAMTDGGTGMARALGVRFLDAEGNALPLGGLALKDLHTIDLTCVDPRLVDTEITAATDVDNPLYGPHGAAHVFSPQKGADKDMVAALDEALRHYAAFAVSATALDICDTPGAGAAGGLGAGLLFFTGAKIRPGAKLVLEALGFKELLAQVDLVITGEGKSDFQSARGKLPAAVARAASKKDVPVICLSGALGHGYEALYEKGVGAASSITPGPMSLEECMENAASLLEAATARCCRLLALGQKLG